LPPSKFTIHNLDFCHSSDIVKKNTKNMTWLEIFLMLWSTATPALACGGYTGICTEPPEVHVWVMLKLGSHF
jgi:hypothetical protein